MQRKWLRVFLLCVACAVCLHGNCAAERWVQYYPTNSDMDCYLDTDSVHVEEFNGHKYVNATSKMNWKAANAIIIERILFDIDNNTYSEVEVLIRGNGSTGRKNVTGDFVSLNSGDSHDAMLQCIKQNRPDVIQKIQGSNGGGAGSASPSGSTGMQSVTANGDYGFVQTLGNGPVQFVPRMVHDGTARYYVAGVPANGFLNIQDRSCPPTAPDSHKPLYIIYDVDTYPSFSQNTVRAIFSYDDATNTFTLYDRYYDFSRPVRKIRIIDKNTVEGSYWDGETYSENNPLVIQFKYVNTLPDHSPDRDGCTWTGWDLENDIPAPIDVYFDIDKYVDPFYMKLSYELVYAADNNEVGLDGLFAFLARKGNVGYAPPAGSRVKYY